MVGIGALFAIVAITLLVQGNLGAFWVAALFAAPLLWFGLIRPLRGGRPLPGRGGKKAGVVAAAALVPLVGLAAIEGPPPAAENTASEQAAPTSAPPTTTTPPVASAQAEATEVPAAAPAALNRAGDPGRWTTALGQLATLEVKGRAPKTGYDRDEFGQAWSDDVSVEGGRNGCDTRNDILRRDLTGVAAKAGTNGCVAVSGDLDDPYTGGVIAFVRGQGTSDAVQIDHVVALSDAWQKGAQQLSQERRRDFANDPRNLLAVDGPANQQKSDSDAASWLPANRGFRCTYVAMQVEVKAEYDLWVTAAERDAIERVLTDCGGTVPATTTPVPAPREEQDEDDSRRAPVPSPYVAPAPAYTPPPAPEPVYVPAPEPVYVAPAPSSVYYQNCSAARAAGAAPLYVGSPGYRPEMDGDRDGVACE